MSEENKEVVRRVNVAFGENNMNAVLKECNDNLRWIMVGASSFSGKENIRRWMESEIDSENSFSRINTTRLVAEGNTVVCYGDMTLKDKDGNNHIFEYCDVYEFENGKISEIRAYVIKSHDSPRTRPERRSPAETVHNQ